MNVENIILANYLKQVLEYKTMIFMLHVVTWIRDPSNKYSKKGSCVENVTRPLRENFQFPCKFTFKYLTPNSTKWIYYKNCYWNYISQVPVIETLLGFKCEKFY